MRTLSKVVALQKLTDLQILYKPVLNKKVAVKFGCT